MTFRSRKDVLFTFIILGLSGLFICIAAFRFHQSGIENTPSLVSDIILILLSVILLWFYFGTYYEITKTHIKYRSGPLRGSIEISSITEIIRDKTQWSGLKPATARKGLIIKYLRYDQLYISPKTNDTFIAKLLELKSDIKITKKSKPSFTM